MTNREILEGLPKFENEIAELRKAIKTERQNVNALSTRLNDLIETRYQQKIKIISRIRALDDPLYRKVLIRTYINGKSAVTVRQEIHYSLSRTYDILREREQALKL